jgi:predicted outer membrane repeat protein
MADRVERGDATVAAPRDGQPNVAPGAEFLVTTIADAGTGSLRQMILQAVERGGPATITFDSKDGPFGEPQTIALASELPELTGDLTLDGYIQDRLWRPTGVTISGRGLHRVFEVAAGSKVTIRSLTVADGAGPEGAGVLTNGSLVVEGVTFTGNVAAERGGGLASLAGQVTIINSTFAENRASEVGGGLAVLGGAATVTNCTFCGNQSKRGGGLYARVPVALRNTILAKSPSGGDCVAAAGLASASTRNLIQVSDGCGTPISTADPNLEPLGYYNGPTMTFPLRGGSPAINLGDNSAAVDPGGQPLAWDQRGNGDPRVVAGYTDIGAFEYQAFPSLVVDTVQDTDLRACTAAGAADCPLRGAIELANATGNTCVITFDPRVFTEARILHFRRPLPEVTVPLTLNARGTTIVTLAGTGGDRVLCTAPGVELILQNVVLQQPPARPR